MNPDRSVADDLCALIDASPSPYHAAETAAAVLEAAGFAEASLDSPFPTGPGGWFTRRGGSLIAWRQDGRTPTAARIVGAHTDSPNLRIKPRPDHATAGVRQLGVEVYGGVLLNSWLDRDLGLSGRVAVRGAGGPETRLVRVDEAVLRIPQLAIHLDRDIVVDGLKLNPQTHLAPIWDLEGDRGDGTSFLSWVADRVGAAPDDVLSWDLMVHDLAPSRRSGLGGVFVSAPRLDNLCSSFAGIRALASTAGGRALPVVCLYDHEEIGSMTATGAASALLSSVLERIAHAHGVSRTDFHALCASSMCLSADMAHGTHPNYADRHEPDHRIELNQGPVVKFNANQRYATDAESAAVYLQVCADAGIPTQQFVMRSDLACGSTIGPVTSAQLGIRTVDVGIAQLAMHSARELCGADDPSWSAASMAAFLAG